MDRKEGGWNQEVGWRKNPRDAHTGRMRITEFRNEIIR